MQAGGTRDPKGETDPKPKQETVQQEIALGVGDPKTEQKVQLICFCSIVNAGELLRRLPSAAAVPQGQIARGAAHSLLRCLVEAAAKRLLLLLAFVVASQEERLRGS